MAAALDRFAASVGVDTAACGSSIASRWDVLVAAGVHRPGLAFARWLDLALVGGVVPPLLANSADVGTLLATLARFHPLWGDDQVVVAPRPGGGSTVRLCPPTGGTPHRETFDAFATLLERLVAQLTDPPVRPARIVRGDRVEFDGTAVGARVTLADPTVAAVLLGYAETSAARRGPTWGERVRRELRRSPGRAPELPAVAARLAVSPRTLQQRLRDEGTTFAATVDDERRAFALALLGNVEVPVSTVAVQAGFESLEGFTRAVRRWTGHSPTGWRAHRSD